MDQYFKELFRSKVLWLNLCYIFLASILIWISSFLFLSFYTHHGEKLEIPLLAKKTLIVAESIAEEAGFELILADSVYIVGKPGGLVLSQNPESGSYAKENRKIYITISKFLPDLIELENVGSLYGKKYDLKKKSLEQAYEFRCNIVGYIYDKGSENHILRILYLGDTIMNSSGFITNKKIPKGAKLDFILSSHEGGKTQIPNLICFTFAEAQFKANSENLILKVISEKVEDNYYVTSQTPSFTLGEKMALNDTIYIELDEMPSIECDENSVIKSENE